MFPSSLRGLCQRRTRPTRIDRAAAGGVTTAQGMLRFVRGLAQWTLLPERRGGRLATATPGEKTSRGSAPCPWPGALAQPREGLLEVTAWIGGITGEGCAVR